MFHPVLGHRSLLVFRPINAIGRGCLFAAAFCICAAAAARGDDAPITWSADQAAQRMVEYFERMSQPKAFEIRTNQERESHNEAIRKRLLRDLLLDPLPERISLDPHYSEPIAHPWCTIRKVAYQLWPGVYCRGLLYMPKSMPEKPAPGMLCTVGHFWNGYEDADEQRRYLTFAKMGYVVFVTPQVHHEDILRGYSYQTYMVWNNIRALDFLQSLPEVDGKRLGVCGLSGGGLQANMLAGLDNRLKAATIAGMTCDFREVSFPHAHHCACNHYPNVMTYADAPEISTLNLPLAVQYLTMNDWTGHFAADNFPTIQTLYRENGVPDRTECLYWPTGHIYDRPKRERTYWWMEKWVRGNRRAVIVPEPENIEIVSKPNALLNWKVDVPHEREYPDYIREASKRETPAIENAEAWKAYRTRMQASLRELLGEAQILPHQEKSSFKEIAPAWAAGLKVEEFLVAGEDKILIPGLIIYPPKEKNSSAVEIYLSDDGRAAAEKNPQPILEKARGGAVVVLPDLRFSGDYAPRRLAGHIRQGSLKFRMASGMGTSNDTKAQSQGIVGAWDRNGIWWNRPVTGMMATDLRCVIDFLQNDRRINPAPVRVTAKDTASLAAAALLAACLDPRIAAIDADFAGCSYEKAGPWENTPKGLPTVASILRYGDLWQWAALLADRRVALRNLPKNDADRAWLEGAFGTMGATQNLTLIENP
ncbi:MAG: acetylxylan esterase [Pirellulales bacterium]|nr:acetylxylan esterase [Pirellulales bacterium]